MPQAACLYFHSPCFDGIVSSIMTLDFLESTQDWKFEQYSPIDYDARGAWLSTHLHTPCAVVDFLYHPESVFWADHHSTTFLTEQSRRDFELRQDPWRVYNDRSPSCASLLRSHLAASFGFQNPRYNEMVEWADKIDSARYASVVIPVGGPVRLPPGITLNIYPDYQKFDRALKTKVRPVLVPLQRPPFRDFTAEEFIGYQVVGCTPGRTCGSAFRGSPITLGQVADACIYVGAGCSRLAVDRGIIHTSPWFRAWHQ